MCKEDGIDHILLAFDLKGFDAHGRFLPFAVVPVFFFRRILEFHLVPVQDIRTYVCYPPSHIFIESNNDVGRSWHGRSIDVYTWSD